MSFHFDYHASFYFQYTRHVLHNSLDFVAVTHFEIASYERSKWHSSRPAGVANRGQVGGKMGRIILKKYKNKCNFSRGLKNFTYYYS